MNACGSQAISAWSVDFLLSYYAVSPKPFHTRHIISTNINTSTTTATNVVAPAVHAAANAEAAATASTTTTPVAVDASIDDVNIH